jgi:hypothetical protein
VASISLFRYSYSWMAAGFGSFGGLVYGVRSIICIFRWNSCNKLIRYEESLGICWSK